MRISECFELETNDQSEFEFLNLMVDRDNLLFLDPTRMEAEKSYNVWSKKINHFHRTIFQMYRDNKSDEAKEFFVNSRESNEIFLGYSVGAPGGTGNSKESLTAVYNYIAEKLLVEDGLIDSPEDLMLFIPDFGRDHLSDFVASIIKHELVNFTIEQADKHKIDRKYQFDYHFWDAEINNWVQETAYVPLVKVEGEDKPLILLPKQIVVRDYLIGPRQYLEKVVLVWRQQQHRQKDSELHRRRHKDQESVSKRVIREEEVKDRAISVKEYIAEQTRNNKKLLDQERKRVINAQLGTNSNMVNDEEWDAFFLGQEG